MSGLDPTPVDEGTSIRAVRGCGDGGGQRKKEGKKRKNDRTEVFIRLHCPVSVQQATVEKERRSLIYEFMTGRGTCLSLSMAVLSTERKLQGQKVREKEIKHVPVRVSRGYELKCLCTRAMFVSRRLCGCSI